MKRVYPAVAGGGSVRQIQSEIWDPDNRAPHSRAASKSDQPGASPSKRQTARRDAADDSSQMS